MNKLKKTITALSLAAATYFGNANNSYADNIYVCPPCELPVQVTRLPALRRGDILVHRRQGQSLATAVNERFASRHLNKRVIERVVAEGLRNTQRNYHIDPCANDFLIIPAYTFNRPRANQGNNNGNSGYSLTEEDRTRMNESYNRIRLTEEGMRRVEDEIMNLETQVNQVGQDLNDFRNEMADDNSVIMNRLSNRIVERVEVNTTKTIRDSELRDRRQREADRLRQANRDRNNFVSAGYGWMDENINGQPYAAGQTLSLRLYGSRKVADRINLFLQGDGRMDFLQEFDSERNLRAVNLNANTGVNYGLNNWLGLEGYLHLDNLSAVIFDNAGDVSVNQYSIGPGIGLRANTRHFDGNVGLALGFGTNDTTMSDSDSLTRLVLDAGASLNYKPVLVDVSYRLESTGLEAEGENRSSLQHGLNAEALYLPEAVPGLGIGARVSETIRSSEANDESSTTIGGVVKYNW